MLGVALSGVGGSYALWSSQAAVGAGTARERFRRADGNVGHRDTTSARGRTCCRANLVDRASWSTTPAMSRWRSPRASPPCPGLRGASRSRCLCAATPLAGPSLGATPCAGRLGRDARDERRVPAGASFAGCIEVRATTRGDSVQHHRVHHHPRRKAGTMIRLLRRGRLQMTAAVTVFLVLVGGSGATAYWSGRRSCRRRPARRPWASSFQVAADASDVAARRDLHRAEPGRGGRGDDPEHGQPCSRSVHCRSPRSRPRALSCRHRSASPWHPSPAAARLHAAACSPRRRSARCRRRPIVPLLGFSGAARRRSCASRRRSRQAAASPTAAQSLQLVIGAKLTYADAQPAWSTSAPTSRIPQSVAAVASAPPPSYDYARYTIRNEAGASAA